MQYVILTSTLIIMIFVFSGKCIPGEFADGRDYRGTLDHTIDGFTCQKWSKQYPWSHQLLPYPYNDEENKEDGLGTLRYSITLINFIAVKWRLDYSYGLSLSICPVPVRGKSLIIFVDKNENHIKCRFEL